MQANETRQALRNPIDLITARPRAATRGRHIIVHGRLDQILRMVKAAGTSGRAIPSGMPSRELAPPLTLNRRWRTRIE